MQRNHELKSNNIKGKLKKEKIRKSIKEGTEAILEINIEYPTIPIYETISHFTEHFNGFYLNLANKYLHYCENKLLSKIKQKQKKNPDAFRPYGEIMKHYITFENNSYISVLTEIIRYDGYFKDCKRFSCVWDREKCRVLPYTYFLNLMNMKNTEIRRKIREEIYREIDTGDFQFGYTEENVKRYSTNANLKNFFLSENGIAFWFDKGTLAPLSEGFPTFVIQYNF